MFQHLGQIEIAYDIRIRFVINICYKHPTDFINKLIKTKERKKRKKETRPCSFNLSVRYFVRFLLDNHIIYVENALILLILISRN